MRILPVISSIMVLAACSSDPMGRIQPRELDDDDTSVRAPSNGSERGFDVDAAPAEGDLGDPDAGAGASDAGTSADASSDARADAPSPVGTKCAAGDVSEIEGQLTPFTKSACGALKTSADDDFYAVVVPVARNLTLRIAADGDAIARMETPNGNVAVVGSGGASTVGSAAGAAIIRVRSKSGTIQAYRLTVE